MPEIHRGDMTKPSPEHKEGEPKQHEARIFFIRHGSTKYDEINALPGQKHKEYRRAMEQAGELPLDLTEQGMAEVQASAKVIADKINPEEDNVVIWSSPAWRALGTKKLIKEELTKRDITPNKEVEVPTIRNFDQRDAAFMANLWKTIREKGLKPEEEYAYNPELQGEREEFETQEQVSKRVGKLLKGIDFLARHPEKRGKSIKAENVAVIAPSHFEIIQPLVESIFGITVRDGGVERGEVLEMSFVHTEGSDDLKISATFRGETVDNITFDPHSKTYRVEQ